MKKEIRERMIAMSYNKRLQWKVGIVLWAILVLGLIVRIVKGYSRPLFFLILMIVMAVILSRDFFCTMRKIPKECLEKNKLENLILCNENVWDHIILIVAMVVYEMNFLNIIALLGVTSIAIMFFSKKISDFFKNKIVE